MLTKEVDLRVFGGATKNLSAVRRSGILFYWPHGLGDFVFLGTVLGLLEPSNRYYIVSLGDDKTSIFEGCDLITPFYLGVDCPRCGDSTILNNQHFGLIGNALDGAIKRLTLPLALADQCEINHIENFVLLPFWESYGGFAFPFHTKARRNLAFLPSGSQLDDGALEKPLRNAISFRAPAFVQQWVESRLRSFAGWKGRRLCLIVRNGYTSIGKNWGHLWRDDVQHRMREGEECRDFMRTLKRRDPNWIFVAMEDRAYAGDNTVASQDLGCLSYHSLFGGVNGGPLPFSLVLKALLAVAELVVGVPTGPTHLAMARSGLPTIGIWLTHHPSWYDEPRNLAINIVSKNVWASELGSRVGSFSARDSYDYNIRHSDTLTISGELVSSVVEELIG